MMAVAVTKQQRILARGTGCMCRQVAGTCVHVDSLSPEIALQKHTQTSAGCAGISASHTRNYVAGQVSTTHGMVGAAAVPATHLQDFARPAVQATDECNVIEQAFAAEVHKVRAVVVGCNDVVLCCSGGIHPSNTKRVSRQEHDVCIVEP